MGVEQSVGEAVLPRGGAGFGAEAPQQIQGDDAVLVFAQDGLHLFVVFDRCFGRLRARQRRDEFGRVAGPFGGLAGAVQRQVVDGGDPVRSRR